jgi:hypothetical protein
MVIPGFRAVVREMLMLERQGIARFTAQSYVCAKYRVRRFPGAEPRVPVDVETVRAIVRLHAWPATKAGYVRAMFWPYAPTLPLEAEISRAIPADLPGEVPTRMKDVLFRRYAFFDMANVAALEEKIRLLDGKLLWRQRRVCTARGRGHLWLQFGSLTFVHGSEFYCGHCLVVKLTGFYGWPTPPVMDYE